MSFGFYFGYYIQNFFRQIYNYFKKTLFWGSNQNRKKITARGKNFKKPEQIN